MLFNCIIWLISTLCLPSYAHVPPHQRNLSIFIDFSYQDALGGSAPLTTELLNAVLSNKSFIITNQAVLEALIIRMNINNMVDGAALNELWESYTYDNLVLLIPNDYKVAIENSPQKHLGLKLDHLTRAPLDFTRSRFDTFKNQCKQALYATFPGLLTLRSQELITFVTQLLAPQRELPDVAWNFYVTGHGNTMYQTAGITEDCCQQLVDTLNKQVAVHAFFFFTCFGGFIKDHIFTQNYPFPIFCVGISDAPTFALFTDFGAFFEHLENVEAHKAATCYAFALKAFELCRCGANNIITVRPANSANFVTPSWPGMLCTITKHAPLPENYSQHVYILLDTDTCYQPLQIDVVVNSGFLPRIISTSGQAYNHYLDKVTSNATVTEFFESFYDAHILNATHKNILIGQLACSGVEQSSLEHIIIARSAASELPHTDKVTYVQDGQGYCATLVTGWVGAQSYTAITATQKLSAQETKNHLQKFDQLKKSIERGEQPKERISHAYKKRLYPWVVTASALAVLSLNVWAEYIKHKRYIA